MLSVFFLVSLFQCLTSLPFTIHSSSALSGDTTLRPVAHGNFLKSTCKISPHLTQNPSGTCSAVLIRPDLVLTAGHCFDENEDRYQQKLYCGFYRDHSYVLSQSFRPLSPHDIIKDSHYVVESSQATSDSNFLGQTHFDFAFIRLKKPIQKISPTRLIQASEEDLFFEDAIIISNTSSTPNTSESPASPDNKTHESLLHFTKKLKDSIDCFVNGFGEDRYLMAGYPQSAPLHRSDNYRYGFFQSDDGYGKHKDFLGIIPEPHTKVAPSFTFGSGDSGGPLYCRHPKTQEPVVMGIVSRDLSPAHADRNIVQVGHRWRTDFNPQAGSYSLTFTPILHNEELNEQLRQLSP